MHNVGLSALPACAASHLPPLSNLIRPIATCRRTTHGPTGRARRAEGEDVAWRIEYEANQRECDVVAMST